MAWVLPNRWFAFHGYNNGQAINASNLDAAELDAQGLHGYLTKAQAEAKPNSVNLLQKVVVNAAIDDYNNARDISPTVANGGGTSVSAVINAASHTGAKAASDSGINAVGDFANSLGKADTWVRVLKVVVGATLVIIGIAKMTGAEDQVKAAAKKTADVAGSVPIPGLGAGAKIAKKVVDKAASTGRTAGGHIVRKTGAASVKSAASHVKGK